MKTRIITDLHFLHQKIIDYCYRPPNYNELLQVSLSKIPAEDTLICLWDITIGQDKKVHEKYIIPLKCNKILVRGNHDRKSDNRYYEHWRNFICYSFSNEMYNRSLLFSHQPLENVPDDVINIHWHRHNRRDIVPAKWYHWQLLCVEDEWYKPVVLEKFLRERKII